MEKGQPTNPIELIGHTAGLVWHSLAENGPMSMSALGKEVAAPKDTIMQAVGWLAREGKIRIDEIKRKKVISLT